MADSAPNSPAQVRWIPFVPAGLVVAIVLLRLAVGWHFYREGTKKLAYNPDTGDVRVAFSSEGFLRGAVGPASEVIREQLPEFYNWERLLAVPRDATSTTVEEIEERARWEKEYAARVKAAAAKGEQAPIEFPPYSPYFDWADRIDKEWHAALTRFGEAESISDEQEAEGAKLLEARRKQLADYLAGEAGAIAEWEHELYRLEQAEASASAKDIPFETARIEEKRAETKAAGNAWIAQVRDIERAYFNDLRGLLTPEQAANPTVVESVDAALSDSTQRTIHRVDVAVTCLVVGVGVCLMLGLFTRLAAAAGIVFLVMVMASQPPWVEGAKLDVFYYQLVEVAALVVLFASAAGRWAGLDYIIRTLMGKCCGRKGTVRT
jgi:uncharacterized membrane protein YphA (DoxX/SURF4 family)